jgi:uncharacterized protein involved in exopolysaccharide biosynthesis
MTTPAISGPAAFKRAFITIFLLTFIISAAIAFVLPEQFAATCRIEVMPEEKPFFEQPQEKTNNGIIPYGGDYEPNTLEILQSQIILSNVIKTLDLNNIWGKKYNGGEPLNSADTMALLKQHMRLKAIPNTRFIDITVCSEGKHEAIQIANSVATTYQDYRHNIQPATPDTVTLVPDQARCLTAGALTGILLGTLAGWFALHRTRRNVSYQPL